MDQQYQTGADLGYGGFVTRPKVVVVPKTEAQVKHEKNMEMFMFYMGFIIAAGIVYQTHDDVGLSTCLTLSVGIQLFALLCLTWQVRLQGGVQGISKGSLTMQCLVYGLRLSSSTWLKGYIPTDSTGDGLYQFMDIATLGLAIYLIHCCINTYQGSYQWELDNLQIKLLVMACGCLAVLVHPDLNDRPIFDIAWTASLYIDSVAMLPQLWMMTRSGGTLLLTAHYVAAMALSRLLNFVFWFHGYAELALLPEEGEEGALETQEGSNVAGYAVVVAHVVQLALM